MNIPTKQPERKPRTRQEQIEDRFLDIPESQQKNYLKATQGKASPRGAIKAFCCECVGYDRAEVTMCSDLGCPLYLYRPFKSARPKQPLRAGATNGIGTGNYR